MSDTNTCKPVMLQQLVRQLNFWNWKLSRQQKPKMFIIMRVIELELPLSFSHIMKSDFLTMQPICDFINCITHVS